MIEKVYDVNIVIRVTSEMKEEVIIQAGGYPNLSAWIRDAIQRKLLSDLKRKNMNKEIYLDMLVVHEKKHTKPYSNKFVSILQDAIDRKRQVLWVGDNPPKDLLSNAKYRYVYSEYATTTVFINYEKEKTDDGITD